MLFAHYQPAQRERLKSLLQTPRWGDTLTAIDLERWKADTKTAPKAPSQLGGAARYLKERNAERVKSLIRSGVRDAKTLAHALGDWESALTGDQNFPILFFGLVLTLDCSFHPRCLYCNQVFLPRRLSLDDWKDIVAQVAEPIPPYVYITGGEPLLLGKDVWGDGGLVEFATNLGCAVNVNTNAALITPRVALQLVKVGTAKLHISLDSADPATQGELFGKRERGEAVLRGIYNVQIARELLGAIHPTVHINCVLTRRNLFQFPALLRFLLEIRQIRSANFDGKLTADPVFNDFAFHLIPVGGSENDFLRPTAAEWKRFYTETWAEAEQVWQDYQVAVGVPPEERKALDAQVPFAHPFKRVSHRMTLDEYCERAARGIYWQGALTERCYVAPSQAFILPDGSQHWCGAHAIQRPPPLGNVREASVRENIRRNLKRLSELPTAVCVNCAGATCVINQAIERNLSGQVAEWLEESASASDP